MHTISKWKLLISIVLTIIASIYLRPSFIETEHSFLPNKKINFGLDLRGGAHLLLSIDFDTYMHDVSTSVGEGLRRYLRDEKIGYKNFKVAKNNIQLNLRSPQDWASLKKITRKLDENLSIVQKNNQVTVFYDEYAINILQDKVVDQSIEIIRMRIDHTGTKEPSIQRQGVKDILLQVPGENDPARLKRVLGKTAKLTFHLIDENASIDSAKAGHVPHGSKIVQSENGKDIAVIKKKIVVSGDELNNAQAQFQNAMPVVHFSFNSIGARKFAEVTKYNKGKRLAVVLDGQVLSSPVINEPILGGDGIISGNFTVDSAAELALMFRAGALPAQLKIIEERTIGPNLGADSITSGKNAAVVGFLLVVVFMILAYGILGIFANITLIIALVYILAMLAMLQATLTLPGIAGIILTIGMAVDANVLIYERIREELDNGASNAYAVKVGFDSAFATITDSNVTTLIAALLLYSFGIGAIKGFAVTLTIGILASMYCSLVITKLMIDIWLKYYRPKSLGL